MSLSFEEFRAALLSPEQRASMGIRLTDAEAHAVYADPATAQGWYSYWMSTLPASAPPAAPPVASAPPTHPGPTAADSQPTTPYATLPYPGAAAVGQPAASYATLAYPGVASAAATAAVPPRRSRTAMWVILSAVAVLVLAVAGTAVFAVATARHWTAVDVPEHPETFHTEEYDTGLYDVTMDDVIPCWVDQDWTDCTNLYVSSYNAACTGVSLTAAAADVCSDYSSMIDEMKAQDGADYYVATLGDYGGLHQTAERATREVSNGDYAPAQTHEAVCYLGFIGECGAGDR
jgi:hypothetical protein